MSIYNIKGTKVDITDRDFLGSGGQANIYSKSGVAYKIYHDRNSCIPKQKIQELKVLTEPYIIKPEEIIEDKNSYVGYTMKLIPSSYPLVKLFSNDFKSKNNIGIKELNDIISKLRKGTEFIHSKEILIVDFNEMNFLVNKKDVYFIDVDNYQTKSFKCTAIAPNIRDYSSNNFSKQSDYYSFAVICFNLYTSRHPYLVGKKRNLEENFKNRYSIFNQGSDIEKASLQFIPSSYKEWMKSIFVEGKRTNPPDSLENNINITQVINTDYKSNKITFTDLFNLDSPAIYICNDYIVTKNRSMYTWDGNLIREKIPGTGYLVYKQNKVYEVFLENNLLKINNVLEKNSKASLTTFSSGDEILISNSDIFVKVGSNITKLYISGNLVTLEIVSQTMPLATKKFDNCFYENMLGTKRIHFPSQGKMNTLVLNETGSIINAKYENKILQIVLSNKGILEKITYVLDKEFKSFQVKDRVQVLNDYLDFCVLDTGICLYKTEDTLCITRNILDNTINIVQDSPSNLYSSFHGACIIENTVVSKITMK